MATAPTGAGAGAAVGTEVSEEFGKELARVTGEAATRGLAGAEAAAWSVANINWAKIFAKGGAHGITKILMDQVAAFAGITDPVQRAMLQMFVGGTVAGGAEHGIDKMAAFFADPAKTKGAVQKSIQDVMPTKANPSGGITALTYHSGSKGAPFTHKAKVDGSGNLVLFPGQVFVATECGCMADDFREHSLAYPSTKKGGGKRKDGTPIPEETVQAQKFIVDAPTDVAGALRSKPVLCPFCFPQAAASVAAVPKVKTFWQMVDGNEATKDCLAAIRRHAATTHRPHIVVDHLEDIAKLDFDAFRILCEGMHHRVERCTDAAGNLLYVQFVDDSAAKEFVVGLDAIGTELKFTNKAEEAAHNAWVTFKHEIAHASGWGKAAAFGLLLVPLLYVLSAVPVVLTYGAGIFGWWENQALNIGLTLGGALLALLWLIPWYSLEGVGKFFGGFFHVHADEHGTPTLANTARNITALLFGIGVTAILVSGLGLVFGFGTFLIRFILISAIVLALIGYDRIGARWGHESEEIHHLLEKLSLNNIRTLAGVATALAVLGIGPLAYFQYVESNTRFLVQVAEREIEIPVPQPGGKVKIEKAKVKYIPTPSGGAFRVEDILGPVPADAATEGQVCVPKGTDIDLPGYSEKEVSDGCTKEGTVGYAVSPRITGRFLDDGPVEYATLEALYLASHREEQELEAVVKAELAPEPEETETVEEAPKATKTTVSAVPSAQAAPKPKAAKGAVDCAKLSPRARSKQPGCR